ncbi:MAG: hypothetical protein ACYTEZ_16725 [Planctomycetota bacterium]|jgi:hypothetical protein
MTLRNVFFAAGLAAALVIGVGRLAASEGDTDVFFEEEPNDDPAQTLDMGPGARPGEPVRFRVKGRIDSLDDVDRYELELAAGDVVGVVITDTSGLDPALCLEDPVGALLIGNDEDRGIGARLPPESPLPRAKGESGDDAALYVVVDRAGIYTLEALGEQGTTGRYRLDIVVARPGLEARPVGTRQILFVDFDGAEVATQIGHFANFGGAGKKTLSPLADFLHLWGLTAADEDAVIDAALETIEEKLSTDVRARGGNGDFALTGTPGEFDIEIRNSRDHADTFGTDPLVARLVIGGTQAESGIAWHALTEWLDPGNFSTSDTSLVHLDQLTGMIPTPGALNRDLNQFAVATGRTKAELVGRALGIIGAHKVGHSFGCYHTDLNPVFDIMDRNTPYGFDAPGAGPDGIFGTADDVDFAFGVDAYDVIGPFRGVHDTLDTIAFGLATGRG